MLCSRTVVAAARRAAPIGVAVKEKRCSLGSPRMPLSDSDKPEHSFPPLVARVVVERQQNAPADSLESLPALSAICPSDTSTGQLRSICRSRFCRPGRLRLRPAVMRQRLRRPRRVFRIPRRRHRPADRLSVSDRHYAGLSQFQSLRGIRRGGSTFRLECVGHVRALASRAHSNRSAAANDYEIASR